jgi:hypothetical protein
VRWCNSKKCRAHFDGSEYGIFNYSSFTMVSYDVLEDYLHSALTSGMSFAGFCAKKTLDYSTFGLSKQFLHRSSFTKVYMAYAQMRDTSNLPPCTICGQYPPVLQADATDLGMPLKYLLPTYRPILSPEAHRSENIVVNFAGRILIVSAKTRAKLLQFVTAEPSKMNRTAWQSLLEALKKQNASVAAVLEHLYNRQPNRTALPHFHFAGEWSDILKVISLHNSITDLVRPGAYQIVHRLAYEDGCELTAAEVNLLGFRAPLIQAIVTYHAYNRWPVYAQYLLRDILATCQRPFQECVAPVPAAQQVEQGDPRQTGHW